MLIVYWLFSWSFSLDLLSHSSSLPWERNRKMPTIEDTFIPTSGISHLDRANNTAFGNLTLIQQPDLCTLQTCDLTLSSFLYIPSLGGNAIFAGCFAVFFLAQIWIGIKHKTWGYMAAMLIGLVRTVHASYQLSLTSPSVPRDHRLHCSGHASQLAL